MVTQLSCYPRVWCSNMGWIRRELEALRIPPLKRFGQHFLIDSNVRDELIEQAELSSNDRVLEIGPGLGFLTTALASRAGDVIAVEKDRTLASYLKTKFSANKKVTIIQGDALTTAIPDGAKIVSSPPYNISSKLIVLILNSQFKLATLLLQEEFARRLTATSGTRDYGRLTVMLQCSAQATLIKTVPSTAFYPKPRVNSAVVIITRAKESSPTVDKGLFVDLVRALFTQRRRRLQGVMARYLKSRYPEHSQAILQFVSIPDKRVFEAGSQELVEISNEIARALLELKSRTG
jgi:16S rRNA (adenine1518-N6/adenine1519-N6)-dimethyltransferase